MADTHIPGIRTDGEDEPLSLSDDGTLTIPTDGGHWEASLDLPALIAWVKANRPDLIGPTFAYAFQERHPDRTSNYWIVRAEGSDGMLNGEPGIKLVAV